jgi:hypothetical protein
VQHTNRIISEKPELSNYEVLGQKFGEVI